MTLIKKIFFSNIAEKYKNLKSTASKIIYKSAKIKATYSTSINWIKLVSISR